jgi:hypothetical protein
MAKRVDTHEYEWVHGHKPRTQHGQPAVWSPCQGQRPLCQSAASV